MNTLSATTPSRKLLAAAILAACHGSLYAQAPSDADQNNAAQSEAHIEEVVVVSSRVPTPLRQIATSVSVVTAADIEAYGNLSLSEVIRQQTAISSSNSGGAGKTTAIRVRGEEGFRTLTVFDGLRLSDPAAPQIGSQFEHLLSSGISRVEILRGPQGLSYGADAGGVVNISSQRQQPGRSLHLDAQQGKYGTQQYSAIVNGAGERLDFSLNATDFSTDGFNTRDLDNNGRDHDAYGNTSVHATAGWKASERLALRLVHRDVDSEVEWDGCFSSISFSTVHDCATNTRMSATRLSAQYESGRLSHELAYSTTETDNHSYSEGLSAYSSLGKLNRWEYLGSLSDLPGFNLAFGADLEEAKQNGNTRDTSGVFAEYLSDFSDVLFITAGLRHDENDDFGGHTSYRISSAYLYDLPDHGGTFKFRSAFGTGFRAPSPYEIAYNRRPDGYPPASLVTLKPETSRGWELGIEFNRYQTIYLEAVYFNQRVEDAITFDLENWSGYLQDTGRSRSRGFELSARRFIGAQWQLNTNYTFNQATQADGRERLRRPRHLANAGVSYFGMDQRLTLNAYLRMSRGSVDEADGVRAPLDNLLVLDVSGSYQLNDWFSVYARVENLSDREYQEVLGYRTSARAAYLGVKLSLDTP